MERNPINKYFSISLEKQIHALDLPRHLTESKNLYRLNKILLDFSFLYIKISRLGPQSVISDYNYLFKYGCEDLGDIEGLDLHGIKYFSDALKLSAPALEADPQQLPSQLLGRLLDQKDPRTKEILKQSKRVFHKNIWLRPVSRSLSPPGNHMVRVFAGYSDPVDSVIVNKDGEIAISSDYGDNLKAWIPSTCEQLWSQKRERFFKFTADQKKVICASHTNIVKIIDVMTGKVTREIGHGIEGVKAIAITADDSLLILACQDGILRLVDLYNGKIVRCFNGHEDEVECVAISSDGKRILSGSTGENNLLKLWDFDSGCELYDLSGHRYHVSTVVISNNGHYAISGSWDSNVIIWDLDSGEKIHLLKGHTSFVTSVAIAEDSKVLSGSHDKKIKVWDLVTGKELYSLEGHSGWINSLAVTGNGKTVISASSDCTVRIWALE